MKNLHIHAVRARSSRVFQSIFGLRADVEISEGRFQHILIIDRVLIDRILVLDLHVASIYGLAEDED